MNFLKIHVGPRTFKTALAVTLALAAVQLTGSSLPIFAAIGAIVAMSRTLSDALTACLTQLAGITCGCAIGLLFALLPASSPLIIGVGIVLVIWVTVRLKLQFATPLSCIVFVSVSLYTAGSPLTYAVERFVDTSIGLLIALIVNILIKPYNNQVRIKNVLTHFIEAVPDYLRERVLLGYYPDLSPQRRCLDLLEKEISLYEGQTLPHKKKARLRESAYLRGCQQLAERIYDETETLCMMDSPGAPDAAHIARLAPLGINVQEAVPHASGVSCEEDIVLGYHLDRLLDAFGFLCEMCAAMEQGPEDEKP